MRHYSAVYFTAMTVLLTSSGSAEHASVTSLLPNVTFFLGNSEASHLTEAGALSSYVQLLLG